MMRTLSLLSLSETSLTFASVTEAYAVDVPVEVICDDGVSSHN